MALRNLEQGDGEARGLAHRGRGLGGGGEELLDDGGEAFDQLGFHADAGGVGPGEALGGLDVVAREGDEQLVRGHVGLGGPAQAELGVVAGLVLELEVVFITEEVGELFP